MPFSCIKNRLIEFNSNNHKNYCPYYTANYKTYIDKSWFESLCSHIKNEIVKAIDDENIIFTEIKMPHSYNDDSKIYTAYLNCFDYQIYYDSNNNFMAKNVKIIKIDKNTKNLLAKITRRRLLTLTDLNMSDWEDLENLKSIIEKNIEQNEYYFVRVSYGSGKHDQEIKPLENSDDILNYLTFSEKLYLDYNENKDTYLMIMDYNFKIDKYGEFRVFIHNSKVTGISQSYCYDYINYSDFMIQKIIKIIMDSKFWETLLYKSFVADIWIDTCNDKLLLIECNPFYAFSATGSALFHWIDDYKVLYEQEESEFRYIV